MCVSSTLNLYLTFHFSNTFEPTVSKMAPYSICRALLLNRAHRYLVKIGDLGNSVPFETQM